MAGSDCGNPATYRVCGRMPQLVRHVASESSVLRLSLPRDTISKNHRTLESSQQSCTAHVMPLQKNASSTHHRRVRIVSTSETNLPLLCIQASATAVGVNSICEPDMSDVHRFCSVVAIALAFPLVVSAAPITITLTIQNANGTLGPSGGLSDGPSTPFTAPSATFTATGDTANVVLTSTGNWALSSPVVKVSIPGVIDANITQAYTRVSGGSGGLESF